MKIIKKSMWALIGIFLLASLLTVGCGQISALLKNITKKSENSKSSSAKRKASSYIDTLFANLNETPFIYVAVNTPDGRVVEIDSDTNAKTSEIATGETIQRLALKPDGSRLYALSMLSNKVIIIDMAARKVIKKLDVPDEPSSIAFLPDGSKYLITHYASNYVSVYDGQTDALVKKVTVGKRPVKVRVNFGGTKAYIGHGDKFGLGLDGLNLNNVTDPKAVLESVMNIDRGAAEIYVIDLKTLEVVKTIPALGNNIGLALRPDDKILYATAYSLDFQATSEKEMYKTAFYIIDAEKGEVLTILDFGQYPAARAVSFTPDGKKAYVVCGQNDAAAVLDGQTHQIVKTIPLDIGG